jgi:uncharacterized protein
MPPHGHVSYLQIPAIDPMESATFYEAVFGWYIERPYPSFKAPGLIGHGLIGQWVDDRAASPDGGLLAWINVDRMEDALERVRTLGGEVLEPPAPDGPERLLATIRDPGGNVIGIVQHSSDGGGA